MSIDQLNNGDSGLKARTIINALVSSSNILAENITLGPGVPDPPYLPTCMLYDFDGIRGTGAVKYSYHSRYACTSSFPWHPVESVHTGIYVDPIGPNIVASYYRGDLIAEGSGSVAFGRYNTASGQFNLAYGWNNAALGRFTHAEGDVTRAEGTASHAEGGYTTASAKYSHAEGWWNRATGNASHAEGYQNWALGEACHAEGYQTTASAIHSHTEGNNTKAFGNNAHSEGENTITYGRSSHSEGNQTQTYINASWSHAEGYLTITTGSWSHSEGESTITIGTGSHSEGLYTTASGNYSHAEGNLARAEGRASHAEGSGSMAFGAGSHAEGWYTQTNGRGAHSEGSLGDASGEFSHTEGHGNTASGECSHAEGANNIASNGWAHAEGRWTNAIGTGSHTEGYYTNASGEYSHAEGHETLTLPTAWESHVEGYQTQTGANMLTTTVLGSINPNTGIITLIVTGDYTGVYRAGAMALTYNVTAYGGPPGGELFVVDIPLNSVYDQNTNTTTIYILGGSAVSNGDIVLINRDDSLTDPDLNAVAGGWYAHAEGKVTIAANIAAHSEGYQTLALGYAAHAEGSNTRASGQWSHAEGESTIARGDKSHAEGKGTISSGSYSHAEGYYTQAYLAGQHATGRWNILNNTQDIFVIGDGEVNARSNAFGVNADRMYASNSIFFPDLTEASHLNVLVFDTASKQVFFTASCCGQGGGTAQPAPPDRGIQFNNSSTGTPVFDADASFTFNYDVLSLEQGLSTNAGGWYSHAQGRSSTANGSGSHAEGFGNFSNGDYSHAEGYESYANGIYSHAEGVNTVATGAGSHAGGWFVTAHADYQTAVGRYNILNNTADYFVVGDGAGSNARSNALGVNNIRFYASNSIYFPDLTNTAQTNVLTYNSTTGQVFFTASSAIGGGGGAGNPASPIGSLQYNDNGVFGGLPSSNWDSNTLTLQLPHTNLINGVELSVIEITGPASVNASNTVTVMYVDTTAGQVSINLASIIDNSIIYIKKIAGSNSIRLTDSGGYLIEGVSTADMNNNLESAQLQRHPATRNWYVISSHKSSL